jgi:hypothetical protein
MGIQYLEYVEFTLAGRFLFRGDLQRSVKTQIDLDAFSKSLASIESAEKYYALVSETARNFGFTLVQAQIAGESFSEPSTYLLPRWIVRVPLDSGDFVELRRETASDSIASSAGPFIEAIQSGLIVKSRAFHSTGNRASFAVSA